jgi:hypothetical protein
LLVLFTTTCGCFRCRFTNNRVDQRQPQGRYYQGFRRGFHQSRYDKYQSVLSNRVRSSVDRQRRARSISPAYVVHTNRYNQRNRRECYVSPSRPTPRSKGIQKSTARRDTEGRSQSTSSTSSRSRSATFSDKSARQHRTSYASPSVSRSSGSNTQDVQQSFQWGSRARHSAGQETTMTLVRETSNCSKENHQSRKDKSYSCAVCSKIFTHRNGLYYHMKSVHGRTATQVFTHEEQVAFKKGIF